MAYQYGASTDAQRRRQARARSIARDDFIRQVEHERIAIARDTRLQQMREQLEAHGLRITSPRSPAC